MPKIASYDEMCADLEDGVYDFTKDGKCSNCGNCCSNLLPISSKEIDTIRRYIKKHNIIEQRNRYPLASLTLDLTCPFRSEAEKGCLIYPVRPEICRSFQCNYKKEDLLKNRDLLEHRYYTVSMREVFYGK